MGFLAEFIMRGRVQAILAACALAMLSLLFPPVSIVSSATIALVTLRRGAVEGAIVWSSSIAILATLGLALIGGFQLVLVYGLVLWLPIWLVSIVLREGRHLSLAVEVAVLMGVVGVVCFYLYSGDPVMMWRGMLSQMVPPKVSVEDIQHTLDFLSHYMTGIIAAASVFGLLFSLFLGRWWQSLLFNPGGFKQEFLSLNTSPRLAIGSIVVIVAALITSGIISEVSYNVAILLIVLYTFIGTAVLHTLFASMKLSRYLVPLFYVTMFLIPQAMLPVAIVGLSDAWMNLRNKISKQQTP